MSELKIKKHEGDFRVLVLSLAISLFGVIMVFSSSYYISLSRDNNAFSYLFDSLTAFVLAWIGFIICSGIDYHIFKILAIPALIIGFVLLALLFTSLGKTYNNATRWLEVGPISIMPGEVIKTCFVLFYSWFFAAKKERATGIKGILVSTIIAAGAFVLIYKQPNFSTAIIVFAIAVAMMFFAGLPIRYVLGFIVLIVVGFIAVVSLRGGYILERVTSFTDPFSDALGDGYQVCQGLLAMGSGGFWGVGLGRSIQKAIYLPECESDFILPIIGEELGFVGIIVLMIVYCVLIYAIFSVALRAKDRFGMLLSAGVGTHLALQVLLNIAVVTATAPPTGVVLPLVSLGTNSMIMFLAELGIVYNVSKQSRISE